jgi:hypothetical protein
MNTISRLLLRYRAAAVRRWVRRQEAAGIDPNAYEIQGYVRGRWGLSDDEATQIMLAAL